MQQSASIKSQRSLPCLSSSFDSNFEVSKRATEEHGHLCKVTPLLYYQAFMGWQGVRSQARPAPLPPLPLSTADTRLPPLPPTLRPSAGCPG